MQQRAVNIPAILGGRGNLVFRNKHELMLAGPAFEQIFEGFPHYRLTMGTGDLAEVSQVV